MRGQRVRVGVGAGEPQAGVRLLKVHAQQGVGEGVSVLDRQRVAICRRAGAVKHAELNLLEGDAIAAACRVADDEHFGV